MKLDELPPEILCICCSFVASSKHDAANLRLVSRSLSAAATPHLFESVTVSMNWTSLHNLEALLNHRNLAQHTRTVSIHLAVYELDIADSRDEFLNYASGALEDYIQNMPRFSPYLHTYSKLLDELLNTVGDFKIATTEVPREWLSLLNAFGTYVSKYASQRILPYEPSWKYLESVLQRFFNIKACFISTKPSPKMMKCLVAEPSYSSLKELVALPPAVNNILRLDKEFSLSSLLSCILKTAVCADTSPGSAVTLSNTSKTFSLKRIELDIDLPHIYEFTEEPFWPGEKLQVMKWVEIALLSFRWESAHCSIFPQGRLIREFSYFMGQLLQSTRLKKLALHMDGAQDNGRLPGLSFAQFPPLYESKYTHLTDISIEKLSVRRQELVAFVKVYKNQLRFFRAMDLTPVGLNLIDALDILHRFSHLKAAVMLVSWAGSNADSPKWPKDEITEYLLRKSSKNPLFGIDQVYHVVNVSEDELEELERSQDDDSVFW